jgi:hypothetical protein
MRDEVLTTVSIMITVFQDVALHSLVITRVVRKIRFSMNFHNEKHVYWH